MSPGETMILAFLETFHSQKALAERAIAQVSDGNLRRALDENTNSIAVIVKHVAGNLRSRFTDFLDADGEKPWRDRDAEFVDDYADRAQVMADWESGWAALFRAIAELRPEHAQWEVMIRGEAHSVPQALARALGHVSYHIGQIVLIARVHGKDDWTTITVERGKSKQFNRSLGYDPGQAS